MNTNFDLIILGAGPAGISTALHLLQLNRSWRDRLLILEKKAHPRAKTCGGGVTRLGINILRELGLEWPLPLPQAWVEDVCLLYKNREIHIHAQPEFVIYERAEFDAYLAQQASQHGIELHENEPALSYSIDKDGVLINTSSGSYRAQVLVAADGSNGLVRKTTAAQEKCTRTARTLHLVTPGKDLMVLRKSESALFDFTPTLNQLQGYYWLFPSYAGSLPVLNQGVYDARVAQSRPLAHLKAILQDPLSTHFATSVNFEDLAGYPIHCFSPRNTIAKPRLLLVGDAAGADPLLGEGISPALASGKLAAHAIEQAFNTGNFTFPSYRRKLFTSPLGRYLLIRWVVAWWGYRLSSYAWFMHLVWTIGDILAHLWPPPAPLPGRTRKTSG